jgi:hypothetical protein
MAGRWQETTTKPPDTEGGERPVLSGDPYDHHRRLTQEELDDPMWVVVDNDTWWINFFEEHADMRILRGSMDSSGQ